MSIPILRIAVPSPLRRSFDYKAPPGEVDADRLQPGVRVSVPFGRGRQIGILLEVRQDSPLPLDSLRHALEILDAEPVLPPDLLALAIWAQRYYHHPPGEVFSAVLPTLLRQGQLAAQTDDPLWQITPAGIAALSDGALRRAKRQRALLEYLAVQSVGVPGSRLRQETTVSADTLRVLRDRGWIVAAFAPESCVEPVLPPALNAAQDAAVEAVCQALGCFQVFLLNGVTGSGKTEVYLRIAQTVLGQGRQVLVLAPEIGLTPQLVLRFRERLAAPLAVLHSSLTDRERLNAWALARDGTAAVIIGTRSAVFAPLPKPGVIIIDEEHDPAFKQQDGFRYHARDLAVVRARQLGIPVVLGSATPSLESLYNAQRGRYQALSLPQRVGAAVQPVIDILDVRRQNMEEGLSAPLLTLMRRHLEQDGQVLLFLNRRGFAPTLICHECGWLAQCHCCDARLVLHLRRRQLLCHHCGQEQPLIRACPACGSIDLRALGQGTERLERVLAREFPACGITRIDRDSTRRKGSLQTLLDAIQDGGRRILIGTQMLAKGHHFPEVTLVGIVDVDHGLFGADFRAGERMAQLIVQVAGRAGRADKPGRVVIQTHHPHHPLLRRLVTEGYAAFAAAALDERQQAGLPPFTCQSLLRAEGIEATAAQAFLDQARDWGVTLAENVELLGPAPAPMERRAGRYRAQLLIQAGWRRDLHDFLERWIMQLGDLPTARKVRWSLDVDPQDLG